MNNKHNRSDRFNPGQNKSYEDTGFNQDSMNVFDTASTVQPHLQIPPHHQPHNEV